MSVTIIGERKKIFVFFGPVKTVRFNTLPMILCKAAYVKAYFSYR